ncbi:phage virion morphogenesis protein [Xanthomonas perforans]|nr:phage virion morphogenesis protein [Xanthomonas perforans]
MCSSSCPSSWVHGLYSFSWYGSVGAGQRVSRIARVHQEGLAEKIRPDGPKVSYEKRTLLGLAEGDYALIRDMLINRLVT